MSDVRIMENAYAKKITFIHTHTHFEIYCHLAFALRFNFKSPPIKKKLCIYSFENSHWIFLLFASCFNFFFILFHSLFLFGFFFSLNLLKSEFVNSFKNDVPNSRKYPNQWIPLIRKLMKTFLFSSNWLIFSVLLGSNHMKSHYHTKSHQSQLAFSLIEFNYDIFQLLD